MPEINPIEIARPFSPRPNISHVIFDMDGTLSWLRHGWPEMLFQVFRPHYPARDGESEKEIRDLLISEILSLNGKQSIFQIQAFHDRLKGRAHHSVRAEGHLEKKTTRAERRALPSPDELLHDYQSRLDAVIEQRTQKLSRGETQADEFVIFGARKLLEQFHQRGLTLIILSGTIEHRVRHEAELLGLKHFFGEHIYGGTLDHSQFSKKLVIERLLHEENISGENLLSFGDGPVEISETKNVGGMAIGVASDEDENGSGRFDPYKREQLLRAGSDAIISDYRNPTELCARIFGGASGHCS